MIPSTYIPLPSTVDGIRVYAPAPEPPQNAPAAPVTFTCPQCGAATRFDVSAGGVACEYCGYTAPTRAAAIGQRAAEQEFTLDVLAQAVQGWGTPRKALHCDQCGAELSVGEQDLSATCPFCASNKVNLRTAPSDALRPRFLVPFKIQPAELRTRAAAWLGKGWFHPDTLSQSAIMERFSGVYLPYWTFDASIHSRWEAEVGYERSERYFDAGDKTWKTRTVIDWRWEHGEADTLVDDLLVPGTGNLSAVLLDRLQPFDLAALTDYAPDFLAGWGAQTYNKPLPDCWETAKGLMRSRAQGDCRARIRSAHVRNLSISADFADEAWRYVLLPVYVAAYRFEDKVYRVMVNGQTGLLAGQKPVAWWKVWLAVAALLLPGLVVGLISLPLLIAGVGGIGLIIALVLLVAGLAGSAWIYRQARNSEAA